MKFLNKTLGSDKYKVGIDSILLFIFVILFLNNLEFENYSSFYFPIPGRFMVFYIITFLLIFLYFIIDIKLKEESKYFYKVIIIFFLAIFLVGSVLAFQIYYRYKTASNDYVHDGLVQTEEAVKFLTHGKNPYIENYLNTPFSEFVNTFTPGRDNPAWYHYVYLPFHVIFSLPLYLLFNKAFNFYDERILYLILFCLLIWIIYKLAKKNNRSLALIILIFNPLFIFYFITGYNDIFTIFFIILSIYLLKKRKFGLSGLVLALACASKQSAWLILPFYFFYLYFQEKHDLRLKLKIFNIFKKLIPFIITTLFIFLPFLIWGFNNFIDDIYRYPAGTIATNYPISGTGFSQLVPLAGWVKSMWDYYPFWIWQVIFCLPLLYFLIKWQKKQNNLAVVLINFALFAFVFWFFSRFFNANYLNFVSILLIIAYSMSSHEFSAEKHS